MLKNHYEVLDIASVSSGGSLSSATLKTAYRRALLRHHPDKSFTQFEKRSASNDIPSIDEIATAYQTLSDSTLRAEYDRELQRSQEDHKINKGITGKSVGLEVIDLDDMQYIEQDGIWTRECRCGTGGGFVLTQNDLESAIEGLRPGDPDEILVGCSGCSLCLKVSFAVVE